MKSWIALVAATFIALSAMPALADADPTELQGEGKGVCYRLSENYRVQHMDCNADKWPNTEFREGSRYSLGDLLELGQRFDNLAKSVRDLFR